MNIQMILSDNLYPPDIRVKKESKSLSKAGHSVFLLCRKGKSQKSEETLDQIKINRVNLPFYDVQSLGGFLYYFLYRYLLVFHIIKTSVKNRADVLHVHDLPLALATCVAGRLLKKPVVFDMHEDYVEMIYSWGFKTEKGIKSAAIILLSKILAIEEKFCLKCVDRIIVVVEEEIDRLVKMGYPKEKIFVVHNAVDLDELDNISEVVSETSGLQKFDKKFIISYVGGFSNHRGLETLLKAMPLIISSIPEAHLILVGDGLIEAKLRNLVRELKLDNHVTFTGWIPFIEAMKYIKISNLCALPYDRDRLTEKSFPHKMCQYMYYGKPILASDVASLKRMISESKCGIIFQAGNHKDLAMKVIEAKSKGMLEQLGKNGKMVAETRFNWEKSANTLVGLYNTLS
ncbi:MAG: glycosyltransferase family 4 protein [Methanothrix sp.]